MDLTYKCVFASSNGIMSNKDKKQVNQSTKTTLRCPEVQVSIELEKMILNRSAGLVSTKFEFETMWD